MTFLIVSFCCGDRQFPTAESDWIPFSICCDRSGVNSCYDRHHVRLPVAACAYQFGVDFVYLWFDNLVGIRSPVSAIETCVSYWQ